MYESENKKSKKVSSHYPRARTLPEVVVVWMKTPTGPQGMALLEVRPVEGSMSLGSGLSSFRSLSQTQCHSLLPAKLDVELSAPCPAPCLPVSSHASHHDDIGLKL